MLVVVVAGIFLASQPRFYATGAIKLVPPGKRDLALEAMKESERALRLWLRGQLIAMLVVGLLTGLGLWALGMPSALTLGLLAGLLEFIPFVYVSAVTGQRAHRLLDLILLVADERTKRVPTAEVNRVLERLVERQQPPQPVGESVRLFFATQIGTAPPRFAVVSNRPDAIPESYARYLTRGFRQAWAFTGAPLNIKFRRKRQDRR